MTTHKPSKAPVILVILLIAAGIVWGIASPSFVKNEATTVNTSSTSRKTYTTQATTVRSSEIPYIGMPESAIEYTHLGKPTEVESCVDFYRIKALHRWRKYRWQKNGVTIFKATVWYWDFANDKAVDGYVHDVCDWRSDVTRRYVPPTTKKQTTPANDPYHAKDYSNEEDFYDDNYDDFFDFEDAEDYYNEHHG